MIISAAFRPFRAVCAALSLAALAACATVPPAAPAAPVAAGPHTIQILGLNDFHGYIEPLPFPTTWFDGGGSM